MALTAWGKKDREDLKISELKNESLSQENQLLKLQLMIAGKGGSPGQPYDDPSKEKGPFVPAPPRDKLAGLQINPNSIMLPFVPKDAETDEDYGEGDVPGHPDWKLSHGEHFDEYGQPIQDPTRGMDPSGNPITIPHLQQTPEEHEQNKQLHMDKYHQAGATSRQIRDRLKPFTRGGSYDDSGGSLRGVPDALRIQLLRDAMAKSPQSDLQIAGINLGGGRHLTNDEIKFLRSIFPTVNEKEKDRLIKMYSDRPFQGLS